MKLNGRNKRNSSSFYHYAWCSIIFEEIKDNISSRHESYSAPYSCGIFIVLEAEINLCYIKRILFFDVNRSSRNL